MKEAAGEANLTVVAIILIAVVVAVATPLVNSLMKNAKEKAIMGKTAAIWPGTPPGRKGLPICVRCFWMGT